MCTVTPTMVVELPGTLRAPAEARDLVAQAMCKVHATAPEAPELVTLLTSELVTAALPGAPRLAVHLECRRVDVRLEVRDPTSRRTHVAGSGPHRTLSLLLVATLATEWGVVVTETGCRQTWCTIPSGTPPEACPADPLAGVDWHFDARSPSGTSML